MDKSNKSFLVYYWISYVVLVLILFILKLTILQHVLENTLLNTIIIFIIITWILVMVIRIYEVKKFNSYMSKYHKYYWDKIEIFGIKASSYNKIRMLHEDFKDPKVSNLKLNFKKINTLSIIIFFSYPIIFTLFMNM